MRHYKMKATAVWEKVSTTCDKCGYTLGWNEHGREFYHIRFDGGYNSAFGDGSHVECDLCHECLKEMIGDIYYDDSLPLESSELE